MFDTALRTRLAGPLDRVGNKLASRGVRPEAVTTIGLLVGIGACVAIAYERWWLGLALWLLNRLADGLDGPVARALGPTDLGGFYDILADFAVYGGVVVALGIAVPDARVACLVLFLTYYLSGSAFLAFSSLASQRKYQGDGRSLTFPAGLAEGSETIAAYVVILLFPSQAEPIIWVWAAIVGITVAQRLAAVHKLLAD